MRRRIALKRTLPALLAAAALVAGAAACSASAGTGGTGAAGTQAGTKAPLVIGISLSLTGDSGDTGKAAEKGYELWASQVNKSGGILGRQVQLKIVDDTTSATSPGTSGEPQVHLAVDELVRQGLEMRHLRVVTYACPCEVVTSPGAIGSAPVPDRSWRLIRIRTSAMTTASTMMPAETR